jgi:DNA-binding protein HU-beta
LTALRPAVRSFVIIRPNELQRAAADPNTSRKPSPRIAENPMNKGQLIEAVATQLGGSRAAASRAVDAVINCITHGIKGDDNVTISRFGTFTKKNRKARVGRNPITREPMEIKASRTVGFRPSQNLKAEI